MNEPCREGLQESAMKIPGGRLFGDIIVDLGLATQAQVRQAARLQRITGQRLGEALIALGYVDRNQVQWALLSAAGLNDQHPVEVPLLGQLLVRLKHINQRQLDEALKDQERRPRRLGEI